MTEFQRITYTEDFGVARLTLNRPDKRNALDALTVAELHAGLRRAEASAAVRIVAFAGAGSDFCAGADLEQLRAIASRASTLENLDDAAALGALFIEMRRAAKPTVALVHGNAIAGGAGLATACDIVIARDDAVFGYPEVHLGFVPAMVMALLRRTLGEKRAFELVARGDRLSAAEAERIGLINRVIPAADFEHESGEYLAALARRSASALMLTKRLFYGMDGMSFEAAIARGAEVNVLARSTDDCRDGVRRFLDKQD